MKGTAEIAVRPARNDDRPSVVRLLEEADLPTSDLPAPLEDFFVAECGGEVAGSIGLERAGHREGLLRSLVVGRNCRERGLGRALVERLIDHARASGLERLHLVTPDAEPFFARFGFETIERDAAPASILGTRELAELCPGSAPLMARKID